MAGNDADQVQDQDLGGQESREPHHVRLPGFLVEDDIGLGDVIQRATTAIGIRPCGGCTKRAEALNRQIVFTSRRTS